MFVSLELPHHFGHGHVAADEGGGGGGCGVGAWHGVHLHCRQRLIFFLKEIFIREEKNL